MHAKDVHWMQYALTLAEAGLYTTRPNPRVGCVIVQAEEIVGKGWHAIAGENHAEVNALHEAGDKARGATAYVTLAPCTHFGKTPPCADALVRAGIRRVVAATEDPNPIVAKNTEKVFAAAGIEYVTNVCASDARALNLGFFMRMTHQRPYVRLKIGMSLDGRTALPAGESQWITSPDSRARVQKIRAQSGAVITGIGTILLDNPQMNVRDNSITELRGFKQPMRAILDSHLRFPINARMLDLPGRIVIFAAQDNIEKRKALEDKNVTVHICADEHGKVDIKSVLELLASKYEINDVMLEAGAILNGAFIQSGYVDEYHAFIAPYIIGDPARGMCNLGLTQLNNKLPIQIVRQESVGEDQYLIFREKECSPASSPR